MPLVRGMRDVLPTEASARRSVMHAFWGSVGRAGYKEMETPLLESTPLFSRTLGPGSDVVRKEMYTFSPPMARATVANNSGDAEPATLTLRPEGTAGIVRAVLAAGLARPNSAARVAYAGPMFRYERPQAGRFRQFTQAGVEFLGGAGGPADDIESIALASDFLRAALPSDAPKPRLVLNSLGGDTKVYALALTAFFKAHRSALSPDSIARLERGAPLRILDSKDVIDAPLIARAPRIEEYRTPGDADRFKIVVEGLTCLGLSPHIEPRLVRGLDYYSHTIFEFFLPQGGKGAGAGAGAVLAGGRYDRLPRLLGHGGEPLAAVGWAAGVERLVPYARCASLPLKNCLVAILPVSSRGDGANTNANAKKNEEAPLDGLAALLAATVRHQLPVGTSVLRLPGAGNVRRLLSDAVAAGARIAVILGDGEVSRGVVAVKDLSTGVQTDIPFDASSLQGGGGGKGANVNAYANANTDAYADIHTINAAASTRPLVDHLKVLFEAYKS